MRHTSPLAISFQISNDGCSNITHCAINKKKINCSLANIIIPLRNWRRVGFLFTNKDPSRTYVADLTQWLL